MVKVSLKLDDIFLLTESLDSADFYFEGSDEDKEKFYEGINQLRHRLEKTHEKWNKIKEIEEKIKFNNKMVSLGRGFNKFDDFLESQAELRNERDKMIRGRL